MAACLDFRDEDIEALDGFECLEIDVLVHVVEDEKSFPILENAKQHTDKPL